MPILDNLGLGFGQALTLSNLGFCFVGVLLGTLIGVLPGLGPAATIAMLLPATFALSPIVALIMLAGIYYGAQYGGSTTAILINIPGETSSIVTTLDGHQMARQGRAGVALATAALASFFAGTVATCVIALAAPPLARVALAFGPAEYVSLMVLALLGAVVLATGSALKAVGMVLLGLLLGLVGTDVNSGAERFVYGVLPLVDGIGFVAVAIGMFGVDEIVRTLEAEPRRMVAVASFHGVMPTRHDLKRIVAPVLRGTGLGVVLGVLPSGGAVLPSFAAYALEKRLATDPERFGRGAIEGVAAPEAANNAGAQTSFIPMLALGLPSGPTMALMIGALIVHGVTPGPALVNERPELFWGVIASMWIGNLMLVILNLPLIGVWVRLLLVPYHLLYPAILTFCAIGAYSIGNSSFDVWVMAGAAVLGYGTSKLGCEPAPLLLGFILGPLMEENLRRALLFSRGDWSVFVERPISAGILAVTVLAGVATLWRRKPGPG